MKENIREYDLGLEFINKLRPVSYNYTDTINEKKVGKVVEHHPEKRYGLIAQEVEKLVDKDSAMVNHDKKSDR